MWVTKTLEVIRNVFLYINDTGLLMAMFGFATKQALLNGKLKGHAKGGIYENFAAETLIKNGYSLHNRQG